ncbi:MFS general substrate transporter [Ganoderma sinense ZZ0214-1]|uniref:MFS general substrate transporter n=1 Tax=Ganoderma sinense ZZ0214-1 TaxID=1077348 RepID=A0A2G8RNY1_9APHY|nr:MFS general substrate transporter [Ganoderma sinense ZZ0214-1]
MSTKPTDHEKLSADGVTVEYVAPALAVDPGAVLRKLDVRLVPLACLLYLLCFLDRANISNAKVAGMANDLHLTGVQFNLCVAITLIPHSMLQAPSNIMLKWIGPSRWLPLITFIWGAILVAMAFYITVLTMPISVSVMQGTRILGSGPGELRFPRFVMSPAHCYSEQAGILPGLTYYISAWYPKSAQAKRIGIMYSGVSLAGAFGGLLAYVIEQMDGIGGLAGWSWIFVIEGLLTVVLAVYPEHATFLTEEERTWLLGTLKHDSAAGSKHFKREFIFQALRDPKTYLFVTMYFLGAVPVVSFTTFLPTIINGLGYSSTSAQVLSIPPNATGCIFTLIITYLSDKKHLRGPFILVGCPVTIIGYVMLLATKTPTIRYAGSILVAAGLLPSVATLLAWAGGNFAGELKRAVVLGMVIGFGNFGGIIASFIYRQQDSPRYILGHGVCIGSVSLFFVTCAFAMATLYRLNQKKIAQCEREGITRDHVDRFAEMGDRSPLYRYTL